MSFCRPAVGEQRPATQYGPDPLAGRENGCGSCYQAGKTGLALYPQIDLQELVLKQQHNSFNGINKFLKGEI
jgi:hypothetical protein